MFFFPVVVMFNDAIVKVEIDFALQLHVLEFGQNVTEI